jgi:hypothetical protein
MYNNNRNFGKSRSRSVNYALPKEGGERTPRRENRDPFAANDSLYNPLLATRNTTMRAERKMVDMGYAKRPSRGFGNSGSHGGGRPSFSRPSSGRGGFGGGGSRGRFGGNRNRGSRIDISKFIKKAVHTEVEVYNAKNTFKDFAVNETLRTNLLELGLQIPTPIQDESIPVGLEGKDVLGIANTGTGKTAAFLIPMIHKMITDKKVGLVLAPTRELALQVVPGMCLELLQPSACVRDGASRELPCEAPEAWLLRPEQKA